MATSFVVSTMIGVGVFTSLGYQLQSTQSAFSIILLWSLGGIAAFTGAMSYIALAHILPRSGGEYHFLKNIYGDALGFVTGVLTIVVGFAAPIAASAMAFESYANNIVELPKLYYGTFVVLLTGFIHFFNVKKGGSFNLNFTIVKVLFILIFIIAGFAIANHLPVNLLPQKSDSTLLLNAGFGVSLVYVTYSFTGWNSAVYMLDEIKNPKKNVLLSILIGTSIVTIIYLLLNYIFLLTVPIEEMKGVIDIADLAGQKIFGKVGAKITSALIAFGLLSTISSMIVSCSRVIKRMGEDKSILKFFAKTNSNQAPQAAIFLTLSISLAFLLTTSFDQVIEYAGFILSFFGLLTVLGLFIVKIKNPETTLPFGKWFWPTVPIFYLLIKVAIIVYLIIDDPNRILQAALTFSLALAFYFISNLYKKQST